MWNMMRLICGFYFETRCNLFRLQCLFLTIITIMMLMMLILCNRYCSTYVRTCISFASNYFQKLRCRKHRGLHSYMRGEWFHMISIFPSTHCTTNSIRWTWKFELCWIEIPQLNLQQQQKRKIRLRKTNKQINLVRLFSFSKLFF